VVMFGHFWDPFFDPFLTPSTFDRFGQTGQSGLL
jgi:hypothetical protein